MILMYVECTCDNQTSPRLFRPIEAQSGLMWFTMFTLIQFNRFSRDTTMRGQTPCDQKGGDLSQNDAFLPWLKNLL